MKQILFAIFFVVFLGRYVVNDCHFQLAKTYSSSSALRIVSRISSSPFLPSSGAFPEKSEIGVFIFPASSEETATNPYPIRQVRAKVVSTDRHTIEWSCTPTVFLSSESVVLHAYHPYQPVVSMHPHAIPIAISADAGRTPDYRHGTLTRGHKKIRSGSSLAMLSWKPVLPVLSFEVYTSSATTAPAYLKAIQIRNKAGGKAFCQRAFLDAVSGEITPFFAVPGATTLRLPAPTLLRATESSAYELRVMPVDPLPATGEIEIVFSIDEKTYTYAVPASTSWRKGYRYFYRFVFTGDEIHLHTTGIRPFF